MPTGFFEELGIAPPSMNKRRSKNHSSKVSFGTCADCGLFRNCNTPEMQPTGRGRKGILIVAEAPGKREDKEGVQLVGESGQLVREALGDLGWNLDKDFWKTNAVLCRPPKNATPTDKQVQVCRKNLIKALDKFKPRAIILFGERAVHSLLGHRIAGRIKKVGFYNWVGTAIPDQELKTWIYPMYHPAYILRNDRDKALKRIWKRDLKNALSGYENPVPDYLSRLEKVDYSICDENKILNWLGECLRKRPEWLAFDYETTGRKPHRKGHKIVAVSYSDGETSRSFPLISPSVKEAWIEVLRNRRIGKIAHNFGFEQMWTEEILKTDIEGPRWCTMLAAHGLNNKRSTQLKFQTYINFGILGYDDEVDYYITSLSPGENPKSANAFNRILEAPQDKVLEYNAVDSLVTHMLFEEQRKVKGPNGWKKAAQLFFTGSKWLTKAQQSGVRYAEEVAYAEKKKIERRLSCIEERIKYSSEVKKWDRITPFNFNSGPQLSHLLFDVLKLKSTKKTASGNPSVDVESLEGIKNNFVRELLAYRKWSKVKGTYLAQYEREVVEGFIHPFFSLSNVDTFRSSSNSPNFQNVPKRDEIVKAVLRKLLIPRPGHRLLEYDYKALEVYIAGCVFKDPNWLTYCRDLTKDMHRDTAIEILYLNGRHGLSWKDLDKKVAKRSRQASKNGFVFPSVYGSSGKNAAEGMWEQLPDEILTHLSDNVGIYKLDDFVNRMVEYDREYWGERYPVYNEARHALYQSYEKKGYIQQVTGFRCYGPMSFMQVVNYPIQGPASHVKLKAFSDISEELHKRKMKTKPIMEIHDSMLFDAPPEEEEELDRMVKYYGSQKIAEDWDWIIVPLLLEKERSEIDGSWAKMESCGYL